MTRLMPRSWTGAMFRSMMGRALRIERSTARAQPVSGVTR
jgi:hypothetical protein